VYTVFGKVVEGMDVVSKIAAVRTTTKKPLEAVDIYSMRVVRGQSRSCSKSEIETVAPASANSALEYFP
jgi:cyclophilin family peptidyl-prolyl cis-trans isomerase